MRICIGSVGISLNLTPLRVGLQFVSDTVVCEIKGQNKEILVPRSISEVLSKLMTKFEVVDNEP